MKKLFFYFLDHLPKESCKLISSLKVNRIMVHPNFDTEVCRVLKDKMTPENVAAFHQLSKLYHLPAASKATAAYAQLWFAVLAETDDFLQLEFPLIKNLLGSCWLHVTSELEVLNAASAWIDFDFGARRKHAKDLLSKVRLMLLSKHALEHLLSATTAFCKIPECRSLLEEARMQKACSDSAFEPRASRHNSENCFDLLFCGDYFNSLEDFGIGFCYKLDGSNLVRAKRVASLANRRLTRDNSKIVYLKGHVYFFNCIRAPDSSPKMVEKYSIVTNRVEVVARDMFQNRDEYCACGLTDNIYFVGGVVYERNLIYEVGATTAACTQFDTARNVWREIAPLREERHDAACVAFQGRYNIILHCTFNFCLL